MKKLLFLLLIICSCVSILNAQKKSILVTGSAYFSQHRYESGSKIINWVINPGIGYGISNDFTLGVNLGYGQTTQSYNPQSSSFSIRPFLRYTRPLSSIFSFYGEVESGLRHYTGSNVRDQTEFLFSITPAIEMNLKNNFALNFSLGGLNYTRGKTPGSSNYSIVGFNFGSGASIGISKRFLR